jgi:tol-pal system protein YbgF
LQQEYKDSHMTAFIRQSSLSLLLLLCLLGHNSAFSHGEKADWIHVGGNVDFEGIPLCALVLINGQSQFSCDGNGRYDMEVPADQNGMITVQVFVDGFAPFNQIVTPDQAAAYPVAMVQDQGSPSLDVGATYKPSATEGRLIVSGSITIGGTPVCALVLANGQSMFSCGGSGQYSLDVPLDQDGNVTLMVFAAGFKPYKEITHVEQSDEASAYSAAYSLVLGRQFDKAIPAFQQFLQRFPGGLYAGNAHYWLGELYLVKEPPDLEASRQSFVLLLAEYPYNNKAPDALYKLGTVQFKKGNREKAREYMDLVISQYGSTNNAVVKLAREFIAQNY